MSSLRVILSPPPGCREMDNSFVSLLAESLRSYGARIEGFSWRRAFGVRFDVLHVNWPEFLTGGSRLQSLVKCVAAVVLVVWLRLRGIVVVVTVHNIQAHYKLGRIRAWTSRLLYKCADERIYMQRWSLSAEDLGPGIYIPHGRYPSPEAQIDLVPVRRDYIVFGQLRSNKGIVEFAESMGVRDTRLRGLIMGAPTEGFNLSRLRDLLASEPNVELWPSAVDYADLFRELQASRVALFPADSFYNSGAVLLALSAGVPVIVSDCPSARELVAEVGKQWVRVLPPGWGIAKVDEELKTLSTSVGGVPSLGEDRDWSNVARKHVLAYERLLSGRRRTWH